MKKAFDTYFGGKEASGVYQTIINCIPKHDIFIEPFGGNYAISRKLNNAALKIVNDIAKKTFAMYPGSRNNWIFLNMDYKVLCQLILVDMDAIFGGHHKVIYFDPPYPLSSRKSDKKVYDHEFSDQYHKAFLSYASEIGWRARVMISTYPNELYKTMLADWYHIEFDGCDRHGKTTEWLFLNYNPTAITELHDISYYGSSYTDRQRIKRGLKNTIDKIKRTDPVLRNHIIKELSRFSEDDFSFENSQRLKSGIEGKFLKQILGKN